MRQDSESWTGSMCRGGVECVYYIALYSWIIFHISILTRCLEAWWNCARACSLSVSVHMDVQMCSHAPQVVNFDPLAPGRVSLRALAAGEGRLHVRQNCLRWDWAEEMLFWQACSYPAAGHGSVHALARTHPHRHNREMCFYLPDMLMQCTLDAIISRLKMKKKSMNLH